VVHCGRLQSGNAGRATQPCGQIDAAAYTASARTHGIYKALSFGRVQIPHPAGYRLIW